MGILPVFPGDIALRMAQFFQTGALQIANVNQMNEANTRYSIQLSDLPEDLREQVFSGAKETIMNQFSEALETNYLGPAEGRDLIVPQLLERASSALDEYDGLALVYFTPNEASE